MDSLTKKWKKKQLKRGIYYYVKTKLGNILIDCINYDRPNHDGFLYDVEEVLAEVPVFDEFQRMKKDAEQLDFYQELSDSLSKECGFTKYENAKIQQLKGLLKECRKFIFDFKGLPYRFNLDVSAKEILTKINEVLK